MYLFSEKKTFIAPLAFVGNESKHIQKMLLRGRFRCDSRLRTSIELVVQT